jgi:hypothetical protein
MVDRREDAGRGALTGGRIIVFYIVLGIVVAALIWRFPNLAELLSVPAENSLLNSEITSTMAGGVPLASPVTTGWASVWVTALSLVGALVVMVPVAWTYILIKRRTGYDESVVHTLLILPVAVTGIVIIVKGSLALAFSLAGIVAAVRFRTTLDDTKDAVYVFLAIGVGLAAGVQELGVAVSLSVVFNLLNLLLWKLNFGNIYVDQLRRTGGVSLGSAVAGADSGSLAFGDDQLMAALSPKDLREVADRQARMAGYLQQESDEPKERKRYFVLMVYSAEVGVAQAAVEAVLAETCIRWQLAEVLPGEKGVSVLEYLVRPGGEVTEGGLLMAVRAASEDSILAAELRSLKKLAKRGG